MSDRCYFVRIDKVEKNKNADKMLYATVQGNQNFWTGLDVSEGDTGMYFYPDAVIAEKFQDEHGLRKFDETSGKYKSYLDGGRVRVTKLRKMYSDGLFVPMTKEACASILGHSVDVDDAIPENVNVFSVYKPKIKASSNSNQTKQAGGVYSSGAIPTFPKHVETQQFAANARRIWGLLENGGRISISAKRHGTSGRVSFVQVPQEPNLVEKAKLFLFDGLIKSYGYLRYVTLKYFLMDKLNKTSNVLKKLRATKNDFEQHLLDKYYNTLGEYKRVAGTRNVIIKANDTTGYHDSSFRDKSNFLMERLDKDEVAYFEVLGYESKDKPIMGAYNGVPYDYGIVNGYFAVQVYRITKNGRDLDVSDMEMRCSELSMHPVERLSKVLSIDDFDSYESFIETITSYMDASDKLESFNYIDECGNAVSTTYKHTNEGIVVRVDFDGKTPLFAKWKSRKFCEEEGIVFKNIESGEIQIDEEQG